MGTPIRLLIADDSTTIRRTICSLLQAQTDIAVCGEAGNYAELLKIFNAMTRSYLINTFKRLRDCELWETE